MARRKKMAKHTQEQIKAAKDALFISKGASNPCGISHSLNEAYLAWFHATDSTNKAAKCPPAILILEQLSYLAGRGLVFSSSVFYDAIARCEEIAKEGEEEENEN